MTARILLIEHDQGLIDLLQTSLSQHGFEVLITTTSTEILKLIIAEKPDLIMLDRMLPGEGGMAICEKIRTVLGIESIPIIIISNNSDEISNRITALDVGADDYITTPVDIKELLARINALLRRTGQSMATHVLKSNGIELNIDRWTASVQGEDVMLTSKEFGLLRELLEAKGRVLTREALLHKIWGHEKELDISTRTVDIHLSRLRRKLGPASNQILTIRNVGYRMDFSSAWVAQPSYSRNRH